MKQEIFQEKLFVQNKKCSKCCIVKDIREFQQDAGRKDGYKYWCKSCMNIYSREHYQKNKEHKAMLSRLYRIKNKDKINAHVREYRNKKKLIAIKNGQPTRQQKYYAKTKEDKHNHYELRKEIIKDRNIFRRYGITIEQRNKMIIDQNDRCAICNELLSNGKFTHIDHNHETGKVRGILCSNCNSGIGMFKDNIEILASAIKYLKQTEEKCAKRG